MKYDTKLMIDMYKKGTDPKKIGEEFQLSYRSVIMKLVRAGVYRKPTYRTKAGEDPITREAIVALLEAKLETDLTGLERAGKSSLFTLYTAITGEKL